MAIFMTNQEIFDIFLQVLEKILAEIKIFVITDGVLLPAV